jgi:hypothetical protein
MILLERQRWFFEEEEEEGFITSWSGDLITHKFARLQNITKI